MGNILQNELLIKMNLYDKRNCEFCPTIKSARYFLHTSLLNSIPDYI